MSFRKSLAILGVVGTVAAAAVVGTAFAQTPTPTQNGTNYQQLFLDKLAAALGTTTDKLTSAVTQARNDTVDQAVKDGKLTQQQGDAIKSRPANGALGFGFRGFGPGHRGAIPFAGGGQVINAVAQALGMTSQDLTSQLSSGKTLAQIAQAQNKDPQVVKDAIKNAVKPMLDQAVQNGRITQDRENQVLNQIQSSDLSKVPFFHFGMKPRNGGWHRTPSNTPSSGPARSEAGAI